MRVYKPGSDVRPVVTLAGDPPSYRRLRRPSALFRRGGYLIEGPDRPMAEIGLEDRAGWLLYQLEVPSDVLAMLSPPGLVGPDPSEVLDGLRRRLSYGQTEWVPTRDVPMSQQWRRLRLEGRDPNPARRLRLILDLCPTFGWDRLGDPQFVTEDELVRQWSEYEYLALHGAP